MDINSSVEKLEKIIRDRSKAAKDNSKTIIEKFIKGEFGFDEKSGRSALEMLFKEESKQDLKDEVAKEENKKASEAAKTDDKQEIGIGHYTAFVRVGEKITRTAEIPTMPVEDGGYVHEHIILSPLKFEIEGWVTDVIVRPSALAEAYQSVNDKIGFISKYLPLRTYAQEQKINSMAMTVLDIDRKGKTLIDDAISARELLPSEEEKEKEKDSVSLDNSGKFLKYMDDLYKKRLPFSIDIAGDMFHNVFMLSWTTEFNSELKRGIKFSMSLQQLTFVVDKYTVLKEAAVKPAQAVKAQIEDKTPMGIAEVETSRSALNSLNQTVWESR